MKRLHLILIAFSALAVFAVVYSIHLDYHLPYHIDEWHHISEAVRLGNYGEYFKVLKSEQANRFSGIEIGFHFFLFLLSLVVDLAGIYEFLPAIWAALSAIILFFIVYKKTGNNFWIGLPAMFFFASIKSNVNITGIWFFTPLTFSLPLIFLYIYFFSEGIEKQNNKQLIASLAIMLILLPIHSISVMFALPALAIYAIANRKLISQQSWLLGTLPYLVFAGLFFYGYILSLGWMQITGHLWDSLRFKTGWSVIEARILPTDIYSAFGYITALIGIAAIFLQRDAKKYAIFLIWPAAVLLMIIIYLVSGTSYLSPYQRNVHYFAIALPFLSAMGLYAAASWVLKFLSKLPLENKHLAIVKYFFLSIGSAVSLLLIFMNYYSIPKQFELYRTINSDDVEIFSYLSQFPRATVMAPPLTSAALFPLANKDPVGNLIFYGNPREVMNFYLSDDCAAQENIIKYFAVEYVISPFEIKCYFVKLIKSNSSDYLYFVE